MMHNDKKIFLEMSKPSYVHGLLVMKASYYTFNFGFEASHKLVFQYFMEYEIGLSPLWEFKNSGYSTMLMLLSVLLW